MSKGGEKSRTWGNTLHDTAAGLGVFMTLKALVWDKPAKPTKPIVVDCVRLSENLLVCASQDNPNKEQRECFTDMRKMMDKHCL